MPNLLIVRIAAELTFSVTHSPVSGIKKRLTCKLGKKRRFVLRLECETWLPVIGFFPVKSQTFAMTFYLLNSDIDSKNEVCELLIIHTLARFVVTPRGLEPLTF